MPRNLAARAGLAILGVVITLAWWTLKKESGPPQETASTIPQKIWNGGGHQLTVEADLSDPGRLDLEVHGARDEKTAEQPLFHAYESVPAGHHTWTVDVGKATGGTLDLGIDKPAVGAKMSWTVMLDGKEVVKDSDTLEKELQPGYAFGLQTNLDIEPEAAP